MTNAKLMQNAKQAINREKFKAWSKAWKDLRKCPGKIDAVLEMYKKTPSHDWLRESWDAPVGYRKRRRGHGEQKIEELFLPPGPDSNGKHLSLLKTDPLSKIKVTGIAHNFPMARFRAGQVIADCTGFIRCGKRLHPLTVEVKVSRSAGDSWFAAVENLQQIQMLRSNVKVVEKYWGTKTWNEARGSWGMVLAPDMFYKKCKNFHHTLELLELVHKKTKARIILATWDRLAKKEELINYIGGYWPK